MPNPIPHGNPKETKQTFTYEELCYSNYLTLGALFRVLRKKGILSEEEILEMIIEVQKEDKEKRDNKDE